MLAVVETHPIQYHAPVYRALQQQFGVPVTAIYGSDFSLAGYRDAEFGEVIAWDTDLVSGYTSLFLSRVKSGGATSVENVTAAGLDRALLRSDPAAVMIVGYSPRFHRDAFRGARRARKPILFRGETTDGARKRGHFQEWVRRRALSWFYRRCSKLLYVGERSLDHFCRVGCDPAKLIFSPYCVDTAAFACREADRVNLRDKWRSDLGIGEDQIALVFSGKLARHKGPQVVLQAAKLLPERIRQRVVVLFVGSGELGASLAERANEEPHVKTILVGFQNQTQLSPYYHAGDLLVLSSVEKWGLVVNEALHHGLPCVVSDSVASASDLIVPGRTGEVCAQGSDSSLAEAIQRCLPWIGGVETRAYCRAHVAHYSVEVAAQGVAEAYEAVVRARTLSEHPA